jgi:hypothetical protein
MKHTPEEIRRILLRLRAEMLLYLGRTEQDTLFCHRCLLPLPEGEFESYSFCPWCSMSLTGCAPRYDESRRIIENERGDQTEIQCGECGGEYDQPARYPFRFCAHCGAPFSAEDELVIVLPFQV